MLKQTQRIERLHLLIKRKATGTPPNCASKLNISERQLYNTLDLMKSLGAPIFYDISIGSYCYEYDVDWQFGFAKLLGEDSMSNIKGSGLFSTKISALKFYFTNRH